MERSEILKFVKFFYSDLFSGKYDDYIKQYQDNTILDGKLSWDRSYFNYKSSNHKLYFRSIIMGDLSHLSSVALNAHENMHGLVYLNQLENRYNYSYNELLPRFIENVCINKLRIHGYGDIEKNFNLFLNYHNRRYAETYIDSTNLLKAGYNDPISSKIWDYSADMTYIYIISMIYGTRLYECYLDSPREVVNEVDNVIQGNIRISDVLNKFDINLGNSDTVKAFQKTLK